MERTRNLIAITIVVFALSAAGCGGSPPAAATPAASLAASDSVSSAPSASTPWFRKPWVWVAGAGALVGAGAGVYLLTRGDDTGQLRLTIRVEE